VRRERKVITVLFADLVGFTAQAEELDPEDVEAILRPYHERLRYELERWGGTVEKFIGDAVMALFGAPVTREDDPERAVRAALAIRDWIAEEGKLEVRIAVNTGEALVNLDARPEAGEGMAAGDVVNTTARLQAAARVNGILVGETTYRATADTIDYREHEPVEAKGKGALISVWEVVQARARFGVDLAPQTRAPLVGRERELELLVTTLERARQQRSPELVTLIGVPGIGKSRLVGELFQSLERGAVLTYWRQGRSLPYGEGVSFWALAEIVKAQAGILETDGDDEVVAKLDRTVARLIDEDADWVLSHLRPLVGLGGDATGSQEEAFAAWRRFFEALADEHPLVLVFEDLQWANDGLLDFVEYLADWVRDVPMLLLCSARLELLERRPAWGGGKLNASTIALAPLSGEETANLISALSERPLLEAEVQATLIERAGGNPLYAEQYVRMLAEREASEELPLPESIQGIIAARLDSLPAGEKTVLQDAAVVGKVFWLGALGVVEQQLLSLQQKDFVQRARRSSVAGETEYAFRHVLVRDVAYGQIPRAERAEKHVRTAEWIESLGRREDHSDLLAHHYLSAMELMRAVGQSVDGLASRAREALVEAGERAFALSALPQAESYYREALALTADNDPRRPELQFSLGRTRVLRVRQGRAELTAAREGFLAVGNRERAADAVLLLAQIAWHEGRRDRVREHMEQAQTLVADLPPSRIRAAVLAEASRYAMLADRNDEAVSLGRQALQMAEQLGLDELRAQALNNIGSARGNSGDRDGVADLERSIALATELNSIDAILRGKNNLALMYLVYGDPARAAAVIEQLRELCRRYGNLGFLRFLEGGAAIGHPFNRGEWDEAMQNANRFLVGVEAGAPHYMAASAYSRRALMRLARDDQAGAASDAERAAELAPAVGDPQLVLGSLPGCALVFAELGDDRRARALFDNAVTELQVLPHMGVAVVDSFQLAWLARLFGREAELETVLVRERLQSPWLEAARVVLAGDLRRGADVLAEIGGAASAAFLRLRAAEQLLDEGRRAEADEQLPAALAFFRSVGATRYVREGEALLAASA
jgi:class 3 adenylate cyclase/tetratricopeptide (TPR) repeat protein